jgi:catechol 2,3-dioxygenase-like lactoylglutathione lyase family enzyme
MPGINKKIKGCGFHHLSMKVRDLNASIKFYTETLGFTQRYTWGEPPKRTVLLDTGDGNYFEISQGDPEKTHGDGIFHHIALRADDCATALEAARAAGAEITMEPKDITLSTEPPTPIRIAFFKGPDGETIELFQNERT